MEQHNGGVISRREQIKALASWSVFLFQVLEASVVVFLRRGFGSRFLGIHAAVVVPLVLVYTLLWEGHDVRPVLVFLACYLVAVGVARTGCLWRRWKGREEYSYYSGSPSVVRWPVFQGRLSERTAKAIVDPLLVAACGVAMLPASEPLGWYLVIAAGGAAASMQVAISYERTRVMDMRDAFIEQRNVAERFRGGDRR